MGVSWKAAPFILSLGILIKQTIKKSVMKKFIITQTTPITHIKTYYVEAETEEDAVNQIEEGLVDYDEIEFEDNGFWADSEYEVEEEK